VEEVIKYEGADKIAAIIMEGVVGSNGLIIPPDDYWPRIRQLCDKYGILLIDDEGMSGWGRTGKWFAVDHWGVTPDIITTAKGITCGYVPFGVCIVTEPIARHFDDKYLYAGLTYNGHALACACALAVIDVYREDKLIENAAKMGKILTKRLEEIKKGHPSVGDVRAIGLFSALELVVNRETKESFPAAKMAEVGKYLREHGLFTFIMANNMGSILFVVPPLCIKTDELLAGLDIVEKAISETTDKATK
jgi:taurine--2-oxoglutarate transaminase